ncbi:hypothetical protein JW890_07330 [candidate division WOR-3 bacterium]|nr:hypothetical protein [candidate division WOR-3 bacterium]
MKETELHLPLKNFLEKRGYSVNCEVNNCDIVARKDGELIVVETKTRLSLSLLAQANLRKELTDSVYIAVPFLGGKSLKNYKNVRKLLRRLEIGLIAVYMKKKKTSVDVILHPLPYAGRKSKKKIRAVISEIEGRHAELNVSGSPGGTPKMTSYRLEALKIASLLHGAGESTPKKLLSMGCSEKTYSILYNNFYGWFERKGRGVYKINSSGEKALAVYKKVLVKNKPGAG